jgi:pSer/pThr/pTyr-binding forkhead associated (FHA) protein
MKIRLTTVSFENDDKEKSREHDFGNKTTGKWTVGRSEEADIPCHGQSTSRKHANLYRESDGSWYVEDLGGLHGTYIDDKRLEKHQKIRWNPQKTLTFGLPAARQIQVQEKQRWKASCDTAELCSNSVQDNATPTASVVSDPSITAAVAPPAVAAAATTADMASSTAEKTPSSKVVRLAEHVFTFRASPVDRSSDQSSGTTSPKGTTQSAASSTTVKSSSSAMELSKRNNGVPDKASRPAATAAEALKTSPSRPPGMFTNPKVSHDEALSSHGHTNSPSRDSLENLLVQADYVDGDARATLEIPLGKVPSEATAKVILRGLPKPVLQTFDSVLKKSFGSMVLAFTIEKSVGNANADITMYFTDMASAQQCASQFDAWSWLSSNSISAEALMMRKMNDTSRTPPTSTADTTPAAPKCIVGMSEPDTLSPMYVSVNGQVPGSFSGSTFKVAIGTTGKSKEKNAENASSIESAASTSRGDSDGSNGICSTGSGGIGSGGSGQPSECYLLQQQQEELRAEDSSLITCTL